MCEEILVKLGFVWLRGNDIGKFFLLFCRGEIPGRIDELENFSLSRQTKDYLVKIGKEYLNQILSERKGGENERRIS